MSDKEKGTGGLPLGKKDNEEERGKKIQAQGEQTDEGDEARKLCRKERSRLQGKRAEVVQVPSVRINDLPFEDGHEPHDQHEKSDDIEFFDPGLALIRGIDVLLQAHIRKEAAEDGQDGENPDHPFLHLILEVHEIIPEKPEEEVSREDHKLATFEQDGREDYGSGSHNVSAPELDDCCDVPGRLLCIHVDDEPAKDLFEGGKIHQVPEVFNRAVGGQ